MILLHTLTILFVLFAVEMYVEMILNSTTVEAPVCAVECVNGLCVPPGLCACNRGWTGVNCTTGTVQHSTATMIGNMGSSWECLHLN